MLHTLKRTFKYLSKRQKQHYFFLVALRALTNVLDLAGLATIGYLATSIASFIETKDNRNVSVNLLGFSLPAITSNVLPIIGFFVISFFVLKSVTSILLSKRISLFLVQLEKSATDELLSKTFDFGMENLYKRPMSKTIFAVQTGVSSAFSDMLGALSTVFSEGVLFIIITFGFVLVNPGATVLMVIYVSSIFVLIHYFVNERMKTVGPELALKSMKITSKLQDFSSAYREIYTLNIVKLFKNQLIDYANEKSSAKARQMQLMHSPRYIVETMLIIGVLVFSWLQIQSGDFNSALVTLGVFLTGGLRILSALLPFQNSLAIMKAVSPQSDIALEILLDASSNFFDSQDKTVDDTKLAIQLNNVCFKYARSQTYALKNINIDIPFGAKIAIIGESGSGKSTLVDLLLRLLKPTSGAISFHALIQPNSRNSESTIAYVPQQVHLIEGSIASNIAIGVPPNEVDHARMLKAVEQANLSGYIESLPNGLSTEIDNSLDSVSGGQKQRIGLARAFYSNAKIIVFDEPTAGLDEKTETEIMKTIDNLRGGITFLIVAHRLNTITNADYVYLLNKGQVLDSGLFEELNLRHKLTATTKTAG